MTGDTQDLATRIKSVLPTRWFGDTTPVLDSLLAGFATCWASIFTLLAFVRSQSRLATASGDILDLIGQDFFGSRLGRRAAEPDATYRARIALALRREHATRDALSSAIEDLTGIAPVLFEPSRPADTGAYGGPNIGYGVAGGWGNLALPFQVFVTARRPPAPGIAMVAGYGTAGPLARASLAQSGEQIADSDIYDAITSVLPTAAIAWTSITN